MLSIDYLPASENYIMVLDYGKYYPPKTDAKQVVHMTRFYYVCEAMFPDFRSVRNGLSMMSECTGSSFDNLDLAYGDRFVNELYNNYPLQLHKAFHLNAESSVSMLINLWKRLLPENIFGKFVLGYQIPGMEGRRIDALYKQPTEEEARERMVLTVVQLLVLRCKHVQSFSLDDVNILGQR